MKAKKGGHLARGLVYLVLIIPVCTVAWAQGAAQETYVGSDACVMCHEAEYENFSSYARKSNSFQSVLKMRKGLTPQELQGCYSCHTTGYGKPGGFVSLEQTPQLKDAGCEVCHGPGGRHVETENPEDIVGDVTIGLCKRCHTEERVSAF
ncbi:MAG: cytochrome c family protein, partial [Thermodesulfobacteriota bacterium]|nr:cytochrome c family protein [Thermodesulfobacteriota bacterium]